MKIEKEKKLIEEINKGIDYSNGNRVWKAIGSLEDIKFNAGKSEQKAKTKEIIEKLFPNEESKYYGIKLDYDKFKQLLQEIEK